MILLKILNYRRILLGSLSALAMLVFFLTIAIGSDVYSMFSIPFLTIGQKIQIVGGLYLNPLNYMHVFSLVIIILVSLLIGVQVTLHSYIYQIRKKVTKQSTKSSFKSSTYISGLFVSLGMGCAACGSLVLVSIFSVLGLGVSIAVTMWVSNILMLGAFFLLLYTNIQLYKQAKNPLVCPI